MSEIDQIKALKKEISTLKRELRKSKKNADEWKKLAIRDPLTGLYNKLLFEEFFNHEVAEAERTGLGFSVVFVDANNLKEVNDKIGHDAGDAYLQNLALLLKKVCRLEDVICRVGGDEFVILLPRNNGEYFIKRLLDAARKKNIDISAGIAHLSEEKNNPRKLVTMAESRMYQMKKETKRAKKCEIKPV